MSGDTPLFDLPEPHAPTRRTDPETSHAAAASVTHIRTRQQAVYDMLLLIGPSTDEALVDRYTWGFDDRPTPFQAPSGIRTRRHELVAAGLVEWTGERRLLRSGRRARVWRAIPRP